MRRSDFDKIFNERLQAIKALRDAKHGEYADDDETFRNLKDGGEKLGIDPMLYAFHLMTKQYNSLHDYVKEWDAKGECSQADLDRAWEKVQDVIVYNLLIYGMWVERVQDKEAGGFEFDEAIPGENGEAVVRLRNAAGECRDYPYPSFSSIPKRDFQSVETPPPMRGGLGWSSPSPPLLSSPLKESGAIPSKSKGETVCGVRHDGELRIHFNPDTVDVERIGRIIADALNEHGLKLTSNPPPKPEPKTGGFLEFLKGLLS